MEPFEHPWIHPDLPATLLPLTHLTPYTQNSPLPGYGQKTQTCSAAGPPV